MSINKKKEFFGPRFWDASLADIRFDDQSSEGISEWIKKPKNFVVILGPPGTGKTHFCAAIYEYVCKKFRFIRYYNEEQFFSRIRIYISSDMMGDYKQYMKDLVDDDLVILDDIGCGKHTEFKEEVLTALIDFRYENELPTVFTSNLTKDEFYTRYHSRLASRLFAKENLIIDLTGQTNYRE